MLKRVSGATALLLKGPIAVVSLLDWTMIRIEDDGPHKGAFVFDAATGPDLDTFWIGRGPFTLRLALGSGQVIFRDVNVNISGARATGVVRPEQRERTS